MEPNNLSNALSSLNVANNYSNSPPHQQQTEQQRSQTNNSNSTSSSFRSSVINTTPWINNYQHGGGIYRVAMDLLDEELNLFNIYMSHTKEEVELRKQVIIIIERVIQSEFPKAKVAMFGSTSTGLFLPDSDIDIVVNLEIPAGRMNIQSYLEKLEQVLVNNNITRSDLTEIIPGARVPIIKFVTAEEYGSFSVDVSINSDTGIRGASFQNDQLKRLGSDKGKRVKDLMLVVKQFLTTHNFRNVKDGGIGGLTIFCLVVFFMQQNHQPYTSIGYDLLSFFSYYVNVFPWRDYTIVIAGEGQAVPKRSMIWNDSVNYNRLSIQHPIELRRDVARGSSSWYQILGAFRLALLQLRRYTVPTLLDRSTLDSLLQSRYENSILSQIGIRCAPLMHHNRQANHQLYLSCKLSNRLDRQFLSAPSAEASHASTTRIQSTSSKTTSTQTVNTSGRSSDSQVGRIGDRNINGDIYRDGVLVRTVEVATPYPHRINETQIAPLTPSASISSSPPPEIIKRQVSPSPSPLALPTSNFAIQLPTPPPSARSTRTSASSSSSSSRNSVSTPDISTPRSISGISTSSVRSEIIRPTLLPYEIESTDGQRTFEYYVGSVQLEDPVDSSTSISDSSSPLLSSSSLATTPSPVLTPLDTIPSELDCTSPIIEETVPIEQSIDVDLPIESRFLTGRAKRFQARLLESNNAPIVHSQAASSSTLTSKQTFTSPKVAILSSPIDNPLPELPPVLATRLASPPVTNSVTDSNNSSRRYQFQHQSQRLSSQQSNPTSRNSPTILAPETSSTLASDFLPQKLSRTLKRQIPLLSPPTPPTSVSNRTFSGNSPIVNRDSFQSISNYHSPSRNNYGLGDYSSTGTDSRIERFDSQAAFGLGQNNLGGGNGSGRAEFSGMNGGFGGWN